MADITPQETTYEQLLTEALELLKNVKQRMGMFENQRYWTLKIKAETLKQKAAEEGK